jgi:N-acetylmuramoyl-L-alanine amidase
MNHVEGREHEQCPHILRRTCRRFYTFLWATVQLHLVLPGYGDHLSTLATAPEWSRLEQFQETITRDEFARLLNEVYAPNGAANGIVELHDQSATIQCTAAPPVSWTLRFAPDQHSAKPVRRFWRPASELGPAPENTPLSGAKIAIDPGHIGGASARMEERWFQLDDAAPVAEGEMTLRVAQHLAPQLRALGAEVSLVRERTAPTTLARPSMLADGARAELATQGETTPPETYDVRTDPHRGRTVQYHSEMLFYRAAEIRHRGDLVNRILRPDLTVCLHFNAEPWGEPRTPTLTKRNHFHVIVNGAYSAAELRNDDVRFEMLLKLLERSSPEEIAASENVARAVSRATDLPAYRYSTNNARHIGQTPFVWARNLLANRVYQTPVVYLEPYVMNSEEVWERVQAGDYEGERMIAGRMRKSIHREYADAVADGLRSYFMAARRK